MHIVVAALQWADPDWNTLIARTRTGVVNMIVLDIGIYYPYYAPKRTVIFTQAQAQQRLDAAHQQGFRVLGYVPTEDGKQQGPSATHPCSTLNCIKQMIDDFYAYSPTGNL